MALEDDMENIKGVIQAILAAREKAQAGIRWPLQEVIIETSDSKIKKAVQDLKDLILYQTNVKSLKLVKKFDKADITIKPNYKTIGPEFGKKSKEILKQLTETDNSVLLKSLKDGKLKMGKYTLKEKHLVLEK